MTTKMIGNKKITILNSDMSKEMETEAIDCAFLAVIKHTNKLEIANYIQDKFDNKYGKYWCCIVGPPTFASTVRYKPNHHICFNLDQLCILLYKTH
ncbi:Dynein light chain [Meloidogyne graminicola]|uniref:Dynein light chain n=1 Tax=Meloidogyne graminicola TaxID=189291 RepID=A0A8S9ZTY4_9BILA|nr:Dynein light chain [Meloidogyne graminicola]